MTSRSIRLARNAGKVIARRFDGCVKKAASTAIICGTRISIEDAPIRSALRHIEQVREELIRVLEQDA